MQKGANKTRIIFPKIKIEDLKDWDIEKRKSE